MGTLALTGASAGFTWELLAQLMGQLFPSSKPSRFQEQAASGESLNAQGSILPGRPPLPGHGSSNSCPQQTLVLN